MPAPATTADFLDICRKSGVVEEAQLSAVTGRAADNPTAAAHALIRAGALTKFQAAQLLAGKYRGLRFDRLKILDRIGSGGMGTVFLCEHLGLRRQVAVKVLPPDQAGDEGVRERFFREARAAAVLDHPNIVRVHDTNSAGGIHYIVMEYVDGQDLQTILNKYGPLPYAKACGYIAQAAQGLQHAHEKGLVHRDIKPANLLVDRDGVVKVLDLGLARFHEDHEDNLTAKYDRGSVLGTADYMAPEQIVSSSEVDIRADIYSLGVTLYALINGKPPFGGSCTQKLLSHRSGKAASLTEISRGVPRALSTVVDRMLAKDPAERYQTPAEVVEALSPWLEPVPGTPDARPTRKMTGTARAPRRIPAGKRANSRLPLVIAAVGVSMVLFGGLGVWALRGGEEAGSVAASPNEPATPVAVGVLPPVQPPVVPAVPSPTPPPPAPKAVEPVPRAVEPAPRPEPRLAYQIDFGKVPAFRARFEDKKRTGIDGAYPPGWTAQSWRPGAVAEVGTGEHRGESGVLIRTERGEGGSGELTTLASTPPYRLTPGRRYLLRTRYAIEGEHPGSFEVRFDGQRPPVPNAVPLRPTGGEWQTVDLQFIAPDHKTQGIYYTHGRAVLPHYLAIQSVQVYELPELSGAAGGTVVYEIDFGAQPEFRGKTAKPGGLTMDVGKLPDGWNAFVWKSGAGGEVAREAYAGKAGIAFRTVSGEASAEIATSVTRPRAMLRPGRRYRVDLEYAAPGKLPGRLDVRLEDTSKPGPDQMRLVSTGTVWQPVSLEFSVPTGRELPLAVYVANTGLGMENTLYVHSLRVTDLGSDPNPRPAVPATYQLSLAGQRPFAHRYQGDRVIDSQGDGSLPSPWTARTVNQDTTGDVYLDTVSGQSALGLRNDTGPPSVQLTAKSALLTARAGKQYRVRLTYQTEPNGRGWATIAVNNQPAGRLDLRPAVNTWTDATTVLTAPASGGLTLTIGCDSVGSEASVFIKGIEIQEVN